MSLLTLNEAIKIMMLTLPENALAELRSSAGQACSLLKTMANEDRLLLLCHLIDTERNVGELEEVTGIRQPTLSQQLGVLRDESLVSTRREGKYVYYTLANPAVLHIMQTLHGLFCGAGSKSTKK